MVVTKENAFSSLVCPARAHILSSFHPQTQSTLGVNGSEAQAETGAKGVCESANMSNEAWVMLRAGVQLPWKVIELAL
jgi:hypothetical protein